MCMKVRIHNFTAIRIRTMYLKSQNQTLSGKIRFFSQKIIISYFASFRIQTSYHKIQFTFSYFCHNQDLNSELFVLFRHKFKLNLEAFRICLQEDYLQKKSCRYILETTDSEPDYDFNQGSNLNPYRSDPEADPQHCR